CEGGTGGARAGGNIEDLPAVLGLCRGGHMFPPRGHPSPPKSGPSAVVTDRNFVEHRGDVGGGLVEVCCHHREPPSRCERRRCATGNVVPGAWATGSKTGMLLTMRYVCPAVVHRSFVSLSNNVRGERSVGHARRANKLRRMGSPRSDMH